MKIFKLLAIGTLLALLLVPAAVYAQEPAAPERGVIEFGFRGVTGEVYGRTQPGTVPFTNSFVPNVLNSNLNVYSDYRNAFYIPKMDARIDSLFGSKNYLRAQSASNGFAFENGGALSRDQSIVVTFGQYGHYKLQFRYDQTPHIFSGTTRTLFSSGGAGVWRVDPVLQNKLFTTFCGTVQTTGANAGKCTVSTSGAAGVTLISNTLNSAVAGSLVGGVAGAQQFTQQENRKAITGSVGWNFTPDVSAAAVFSREHQAGVRPIGFVMGNSSSGFVAEAPEYLDYYTNTLRLTTEFGRKSWDALLGYQGQFFQNNTPSMVVANPFSTVYDVGNFVGTSVPTTGMGPAAGRMDLYPDNRYQQFIAQGAADLGKYVHLMANVTPGFMSQNASFQPLTTNVAINITPPAGYPAYLPASSLNGKVDTLAMNYTAVLKATKDLKFVAKYQHYKYDDQTPELLVRPVIADTAFLTSFHGSAGLWFDPVNTATCDTAVTAGTSLANCRFYLPTEYSSFTNRLFDIGGTWFFTKKNSVKFGYQRGWTDRTNREVAESIEDSIYGAVDLHLHKNVLLRVSGRHQNRMPQEYEIDTGSVFARMLDQSTRIRNRGDASLTWDATDRLSFSAFWGTLQDNFNQKDEVNSLVNLGDTSFSPLKIAGTAATPIYGPYYAYGLLTNVGRNFGFDVNYMISPKVTLFAEYGREKNTAIFIQGRGQQSVCIPTGSGFIIPTGSSGEGCDPINDLLSAPKDVVNSYYGGLDISPSKKVDFSLYYSLSLSQSFAFADGVNCQIGAGVNTFCDTHFANWKLDSTSNPAVNFGYPTTVNRIHDVGAIARFKLSDKLIPKLQYSFRQFAYNDWQTGITNPYNQGLVGLDNAGSTTIYKLLLLGADQPSYRAHIFSATLEYHF